MNNQPITMMLLTSLFFSNSVLAQESNDTAKSTDNISKYLSTIIAPVPIKRIEPEYPIKAARSGREGWARVSFVIDEEGKVKDVIVKETSGSKDITRAAKKAVKKWRYKPAMENGKAIQQCVNMVQMDFKMGRGRTQGTTKNFRSRYTSARKALEAEDYVTVEALIAQMKKKQYLHLSEHNYLQWLSADYAKAQGDKRKQLQHLNLISMSLDTLSNDKQKLSVLYQTFNLQVELNRFQAAHATYDKLQSLPAAKPYLEQFSEVMAKVDKVIAGDKNLVIQANIKEDFWTASLVRKEFSLIDVDGSLHTLDVRCANKRHQYTIAKDNTWKLPDSWENCSIYVYGEPKTSFKLVEHPLSI